MCGEHTIRESVFFSKPQNHWGGGANTSTSSCTPPEDSHLVFSSSTQLQKNQTHPARSTHYPHPVLYPIHTVCLISIKEKVLILCQAKNFKCKRRISKRSIIPIYTANEHSFSSNFMIQIASSALVHLSHNPPQSRIHRNISILHLHPYIL